MRNKLLMVAALAVLAASCGPKYETVKGDPLQAKIYTLPNGLKARFLNDETTYLGNQMESEFGGDRCFGVLAAMDFIMVCTYEKDGLNPELVLYKKR